MRKPAATSHRGVTRQAVAEAAAGLVAADGLEALSVRQVANRLGVWPTTVMHHAGGRRDGLVTLVIEHLATGIRTEPHGDWRTRLTELGHEIRRVALEHRGLADQLLRSGATGPQALRLADAILAALQDAGLGPDVAQDAYDVFLTYVLGSAGRQTTATAPARWRTFEIALDEAAPDAYPALRDATRGGTARGDDARFSGGLDLVLDAIAACRQPPSLFLVVGLPGAGKTVRARELAAERGALLLTPDAWMISLFGQTQPEGKRDVLEGRLVGLAIEALRLRLSVVLDFGLWSRDERSALRWIAASVGATCEVIYLPVDREVQLSRIQGRWKRTPEQTFPMTEAELDAWRNQFDVPDADELANASLPSPPPGDGSWFDWAARRWPSLPPSP